MGRRRENELSERRPILSLASLPDRIAADSGNAINLVGRFLIAVVLLPGGFAKLAGLSAFAASLEARGMPAPYLLAVIGGSAEFFGALAVLLGIRIRYAAALMVAFVIIASGIAHRYWELTDANAYRVQRSAFFKNIGLVAGFLFLFVSGGGSWSVDALLRGRNSRS